VPHAVLKIASGVNTTETPAYNENSGISSSNLIRYFYDANGPALVGKLGGWTKFFASARCGRGKTSMIWRIWRLGRRYDRE
jgi:hypothetical protein